MQLLSNVSKLYKATVQTARQTELNENSIRFAPYSAESIQIDVPTESIQIDHFQLYIPLSAHITGKLEK